jgi:hypothetical protein
VSLLHLVAAAPSPSPTVRQLDTTTVTPGLAGFIATFLLVVAAIAVFMFMARSLRRATRNARAAGIPVTEPQRLGRPKPAGGPDGEAPGAPGVPGRPDGDGAPPRG